MLGSHWREQPQRAGFLVALSCGRPEQTPPFLLEQRLSGVGVEGSGEGSRWGPEWQGQCMARPQGTLVIFPVNGAPW